MSILCDVFGHKVVRDLGRGEHYASDLRIIRTDSLQRHHIALIVPCPRCGERYEACVIHDEWVINLIKREGK